MGDVSPDTRRGAALVIAIVIVLIIVAMVVFFLNQSLTYDMVAQQDTVKVKALEMGELGIAMAQTRLRRGDPLEKEEKEKKEDPPGSGRMWDYGEVSGTTEPPDSTDPKEYRVEVWHSALPPIQGRADGGSDNQFLVDADLRDVRRAPNWFIGKRFMMTTGELASLLLEIKEFDASNGRIRFEPQRYKIAVGDRYEIAGGREYQFISHGTHSLAYNLDPEIAKEGTTRHIETWFWRQFKPLKKYAQRGAVVANGRVQVTGSIEIDGRDHCANGGRGMPDPDAPCMSVSDDHHVVDPGVKGISSTGLVDQQGSSGIGGDGKPPAGKADSPSGIDYTEQYPDPASIDNGNDDDGDGMRDEEPYNGIDDDRNALGEIVPDNERDEDLRFPKNPDEALGLEKGTLEGIAKEMGTYFRSQGEFDAFYRDHGKVLPGGKVYYLAFPEANLGGGGGGFGMDMGGTDEPQTDPEELKPILLIHHYEDADGNPVASVKPLQVVMKGLLIMDGVSHINAGTRIIGGVQTLSSDVEANVFGNGQAKIWYSSAALQNLPDDVTAAAWNASTWREEHPPKEE